MPDLEKSCSIVVKPGSTYENNQMNHFMQRDSQREKIIIVIRN